MKRGNEREKNYYHRILTKEKVTNASFKWECNIKMNFR